MRLLSIFIMAVCMLGGGMPVRADNLFQGKTIRIIIPTSVGGSYGVYAQLVSRHFGRHLPGNPAVITQAMPGAGGLVALNYLGSSAVPRDGSVITLAQVTLVQEALFNKDAHFEARDFKWIGRIDALSFLGVASKRSGITSLQDARMRDVITGAPGLSNIPAQSPLVLNQIAGTRFKLISGYSGTGQVFLALERGEVEFAVTSISAIKSLHADAMRKGELVPVFAHAGRRLSDYSEVPILSEFANNEVERKFLRVFSITSDIGRSLAAPPGTPDGTVEVFRTAYRALVKDATFLAEAAKLDVDLDRMEGDELGRLVAEAMNISPADRAEMGRFYEDLFGSLK